MTTFSKFQNDFTHNIMGYSGLGIIISTCLGSVAVMITLMHGHTTFQMLAVMVSVILCSVYNAAIITIQKPKLIFNLLIASLVVNILIILLGLSL